MPWTYSSVESYLEQKEKLQPWRRRHIKDIEERIKKGELPGVQRGKLMYFPLSGVGNAIIAKIDESSGNIEFQRIQLQT